jgi:hypothetical protein
MKIYNLDILKSFFHQAIKRKNNVGLGRPSPNGDYNLRNAKQLRL